MVLSCVSKEFPRTWRNFWGTLGCLWLGLSLLGVGLFVLVLLIDLGINLVYLWVGPDNLKRAGEWLDWAAPGLFAGGAAVWLTVAIAWTDPLPNLFEEGDPVGKPPRESEVLGGD
jgi:hypothetical protein